MDHKKLLSTERLTTLFKLFDKDANGFVSREEIREFFSLHDSYMDDFLGEFMNELDQNHDGNLQFEEFKSFMSKAFSRFDK